MKPILYTTVCSLFVLASACNTTAVTERSAAIGLNHGVSEKHRSATYWIQSQDANEQKRVLLSSTAIQSLNQRNEKKPWGYQDILNTAAMTPEYTKRELAIRSDWLAQRVQEGKYVEEPHGMLLGAQKIISNSNFVHEYRVVHTQTVLYCVPSTHSLFTQPIDRAFNRNHCSGLQPGEAIRVLRKTQGGWLHAHAGHSIGWVRIEKTTPPITAGTLRKFATQTPRIVLLKDRYPLATGTTLRWGSHYPSGSESTHQTVTVATPKGLESQSFQQETMALNETPSDAWSVWPLAFTRQNVFKLALSMQGTQYGWGGRNGGRDCSRFLLDLFRSFDIRLGRHSTAQSRSGLQQIELKGLSLEDKTARIQEASKRGVVLLYMPGHIMLYLGEGPQGPLAISSLSEYVVPTNDQSEKVVRVDQVVVTGLELGTQTTRGSFLQRLTRLAVFGQ